jgi:proton-dependent oligopeptide transporter, POT family
MAQASRRTIGRHPVGLAVLAATELAERFSYYGMTSLLVLYMVKQLLLAGHAEHVLGLSALRGLFQARGPMSDQAFASLIYGWYGGLIYFTPIIGGWVADRWLGKKATVVLGALLMAGGHLAMTFDATFLVALSLLILGSGALKGNISAQVGTLYRQDEESLRARGFTIFSTAINVGAVIGPLATGAAAQAYGFHRGFGFAAGLMIVALIVYLAGSRTLPASRPAATTEDALPALTPEERRRTWALIGVIALTVLPNIAYPMIWNVGILWADQHVDLVTPIGAMPASWFTSVDPLGSIASAAPLVGLWAWQARHGREPHNLTKIAIGCAITGLSALVLAAGAFLAGPAGKVPLLWALAGFFGMGIAFMWYWPITLAVVSQGAPAKVNSTLVSACFLSLFAGLVLMGWVGSFYQTMSPAAFWAMDATIGFIGGAIILIVRKPLNDVLQAHSAKPNHSPG